MNLFIYSDESSVFDKAHNKYYVYAGLIFFNKKDKDDAIRLFLNAEKILRENNKNFQNKNNEIKANSISIKEKYSLYRSIKKGIQFALIIEQDKVLDRIYKSKKDKQRFLDYVYKIGLKKILKSVFNDNQLSLEEVENIYIYVDEHTTATNGKYELKEAIEQEFKLGTYNENYSRYFEPIFKNLKTIDVKFCNSEKATLIRCADIIANRVYNLKIKNNCQNINKKIKLVHFP